MNRRERRRGIYRRRIGDMEGILINWNINLRQGPWLLRWRSNFGFHLTGLRTLHRRMGNVGSLLSSESRKGSVDIVIKEQNIVFFVGFGRICNFIEIQRQIRLITSCTLEKEVKITDIEAKGSPYPV